MMKYLLKLFRFVRNPSPYLSVISYKTVASPVSIRFYHRVIIPLLVNRLVRKARKRKVNVVFLAMNTDMWRYGCVYGRFVSDKRFKPYVVTAMRSNESLEMQIADQETMVKYFTERGIPVVKGYDINANKWIDLESLKPDIVFYAQPYDDVIEKSFEFRKHFGFLHCYTPYSFQMTSAQWYWDNDLQNYCWRQYLVGEYQCGLSQSVARNRGRNAVPVGYCLEEEVVMAQNNVNAIERVWRNDRRKRVIWAPHHSIREQEMFKVSSFLEICDFMLSLRDEYSDRVIFAFKPHPILRGKLYEIWGKSRTDAYYSEWENSDSSFDASGDYKYLFLGSDAMIHCSGSFMTEYLYVDKPALYVYSKTRNPPDTGEVGESALEAHYSANSRDDIKSFLDKVVLGGEDAKKTVRGEVVKRYLKSANGKLFSQNVYEDIVNSLGLKCQSR